MIAVGWPHLVTRLELGPVRLHSHFPGDRNSLAVQGVPRPPRQLMHSSAPVAAANYGEWVGHPRCRCFIPPVTVLECLRACKGRSGAVPASRCLAVGILTHGYSSLQSRLGLEYHSLSITLLTIAIAHAVLCCVFAALSWLLKRRGHCDYTFEPHSLSWPRRRAISSTRAKRRRFVIVAAFRSWYTYLMHDFPY